MQPAPQAVRVLAREVVWPDASTIDHAALEALPPLAAERVAASRVPVLLPPRVEWLAAANVVTKHDWTSGSMRQSDAGVVTTARRLAHEVPGLAPVKGNRPLRRTTGFVTQNERVWVASWIENNVAYTVEVECDKASDARCADDSFVIGLANELVYVGGAGERGEKTGTP